MLQISSCPSTVKAQLIYALALLVPGFVAGSGRHARNEQEAAADEAPLVVTRGAMGVRFQLTLPGNDDAALLELATRCFDEVERLERLLSNWSPESAISLLNAKSGGSPTLVDPELAVVIRTAFDFRIESEGAFDPTVGALLRRLGFYDRARVVAPTDEEVAAIMSGCAALKVDDAGRVLLEATAGLELDLSGVSKGWVVDRVVELLREAGITNAFVAAGPSTVCALGTGPDGEGWPFFVPADGGRTAEWKLRDEAVSTSGRDAFKVTLEGEARSHVIDPRTGRSISHGTRQTIYRCSSATEADMTSTALLVMGAERARAWASSRTGRGLALLVTDPPDGARAPGVVALDL